MPLYTSVQVTTPPVETQGVVVAPAQTLTPPIYEVTPIRQVTPRPDDKDLSGYVRETGDDPGNPVRAPLPPDPVDQAPLMTVHFQVESSKVAPDDAVRLSALDPRQCYLVIGRSDPTGPDRLVLGLSLSRAAAVAAVMRSAGLRAEIMGVGSYRASLDPKDYPQERVADVVTEECPSHSPHPLRR